MRIGILGAGHMAAALGSRWASLGHDVMVGGRTPARAADVATAAGLRHGTLQEAADFGEVLLLAVLYEGVDLTLDLAGAGVGKLHNRLLIDCTNPVEVPGYALVVEPESSAAEAIQSRTGARVIKAFNLCHADVWKDGPARYDGRPLTVPFAGDNQDAKTVARSLIESLECEPADLGPLFHARYLEAMAAIVINLLRAGHPMKSVFNFIPPDEVAA